MVNVSVAVMAHPRREALAEALSASLSGSSIVYDPEPDSGFPCPWRTHRAVLEATPADATHRLVIQDDTIVCRNLIPTLDLIAARFPERLVSLFVAHAPRPSMLALFDACRNGERYCQIPSWPWVPVLALLWPVKLIEPTLAWVDRQNWRDNFCSDDAIVGRAMSDFQETVYATVPSLVDHPDEVESLLGRSRNYAGRDLDRVAACFLDDHLDPLDLGGW